MQGWRVWLPFFISSQLSHGLGGERGFALSELWRTAAVSATPAADPLVWVSWSSFVSALPGCLVLPPPQVALLAEAVKVVRTPQIPPGEHRRVRAQLLMCDTAALGTKCPQSLRDRHHLAHRAPPRPVLSSSFPFSHLTLKESQECPSLLTHSELVAKEARSRDASAPVQCFFVHTQS